MGRPRKNVPVYYTHPVLLDEKTYQKVLWARRFHEPLGSVVQRLIAQAEADATTTTKTVAAANPEELKLSA